MSEQIGHNRCGGLCSCAPRPRCSLINPLLTSIVLRSCTCEAGWRFSLHTVWVWNRLCWCCSAIAAAADPATFAQPHPSLRLIPMADIASHFGGCGSEPSVGRIYIPAQVFLMLTCPVLSGYPQAKLPRPRPKPLRVCVTFAWLPFPNAETPRLSWQTRVRSCTSTAWRCGA